MAKRKKRAGKMWNKSSSSSKKSKSLSGINETAASKLFADLVTDDDDPDNLNMEGIVKLGEKLKIDAVEDIRILMLLWKMGCKNERAGHVTKNEWMQGCATLQVDSWAALNKLKPSLDTGFLERTEFKDFYKFCFQFNLMGTYRTLDKEIVCQLLQLVLKDRVDEQRVTTFCQFVEENKGYTRITLDQWTSFLDFCYEVPDLDAYDESNSAWPVLIDEYVEHMEQEPKKT